MCIRDRQMMAQDRKIVEEAYAGDIIGVFDPGIFSIGDTLCLSNEKFEFEGIPTFAPEHFARVRQMDTMKRKQFIKGVNQIAQEGAIQIFQEFTTSTFSNSRQISTVLSVEGESTTNTFLAKGVTFSKHLRICISSL